MSEIKTNYTQKSTADVEARLFRVYRRGMYAFGVVMAAGIVAGTWFGLHKVNAHDTAHRIAINSPINKSQRAANPFKAAKTVEFTLPYMHGTNANTLKYMSQLSASRVKDIKNGFEVEGVYRSGNLEHKTRIKLACEQALCELKFKLPSRYVLTPRLDGRRVVNPQRNFEIYSNGYVMEVKDSKLGGIAPVADSKLALFNNRENLKPFYKEAYFDDEGKMDQSE